MRVWAVARHDEPVGMFMTQQEAEMFATMKWPNEPQPNLNIAIFEWDETMPWFLTMDQAYAALEGRGVERPIIYEGW